MLVFSAGGKKWISPNVESELMLKPVGEILAKQPGLTALYQDLGERVLIRLFAFETQKALERQVYLTFGAGLARTVAGWSPLDRGQTASLWDEWEGCEDSAAI